MRGACFYTMLGLPAGAWERFAVWLALGASVYFLHEHRYSRLRRR